MQKPFANSLQTSNAPSINPIKSKPLNRSYSQNALFDKMKTRHRFSALLGVRRGSIFSIRQSHQSKTIKSWSGTGVIGAILGVSGHRDAKEVEAEGTKTRAERNEKGSPTHLNHRPRHILF